MAGFGGLWVEISVNRKNRLLGQVLDAICVNLDTRKIVAVRPRETFSAQIVTMAEKTGVTVLEDPRM